MPSPQTTPANASALGTPRPQDLPRQGILARLALLAFITGFSGAIMPGPLLVKTIEETSLQGLRAVLGLMTGHALLELIVVILLALGLHPLLGRRRVRAAIGLVGGAALLYLGAGMIRGAWGLTLQLSAASASRTSFPMLMLLGAWISIINPYFAGWWATVGAGQLAHMAPRRRVRAAIGLIGGAALLYMGADMIRGASGLTLQLNASSATQTSFPMLMLLGAWISIINPYFAGWWATVGAGQLAHMAPRRPSEYAVFYLGHEIADYTWYGFVGLLLITSRRWLTDGIYRALIVVCGAALLLIAAQFLKTGWRLLRQ